MTTDIAGEFWRLAQADLAAAERLAGEDPIVELALFHCQQAVEKALKSLIARRGTTPHRTHDLLMLLSLAGLPEDASTDEDAALLTQYGVAARYPFPTRTYHVNEVPAALAAARRILDRISSARRSG
jgi:HEPN domain-containing protein